jgi:hypothetical protein
MKLGTGTRNRRDVPHGLEGMAGTTRLELATSAVTGQRSNQLNYVPAEGLLLGWWAVQGSNLRPPACKAGALTN